MTRLLDIGVSGLTAHQRALATTGQNISNAGVEGYSRQEVVFETRGAQFAGDAFVWIPHTCDWIPHNWDCFCLIIALGTPLRFGAVWLASSNE